MRGNRRLNRRIWLGVLTAGVVLCSRAEADTPEPRRVRVERCAPAAIQDVRLPFPVAVDEVRVFVANHSPPSGEANVRVDTGKSDRVMRIQGQISKSLQFSPALASSVFHVSLDPVFEAPRGACIERVELVHDGRRVATIRP